MTPREWNHVLDHKVEWSIAYPAVARAAKAYLSHWHHPGITTNDLVEVLYPIAVANGDGIYARRRIFTALDALREHELADWCHQEEPTRARFGKMIRRVRWHQPQAVTEAEEVQTPEPSPVWVAEVAFATQAEAEAFYNKTAHRYSVTVRQRVDREAMRAELAALGPTRFEDIAEARGWKS